jgi:hypothetical protein
MKLEVWAKRFDGEEANLVVDAVEDNIAMVVKAIIDAGNGYVILSEADETYVQATTKGPVDDGFIVERRDGCAGEHYATDRRANSVELVCMLVGYLRGDPSWSHAISWHRMVADPDARPSA